MKDKYHKLLKTEEWKSFRLNILELDNYTCTKCGTNYRNRPSNLHVHHKVYHEGLSPWQYDPEDVTTYCRRCHAEEHDLLEFPLFGWSYIGMDDLGDKIGECEFCGHELRYQHTIYHPNRGFMYVGATHADQLTENEEASETEKREKRKKNSLKKWKEDNGKYNLKLGRHIFEILKDNNSFILKVDDYYLNEKFINLTDAKNFAFDIFVKGMVKELISDLQQEYWEHFKSIPEWELLSRPETKLIECNYLNHYFCVRKEQYKIYVGYEKVMQEYVISVDGHNLEPRKTIQETQLFLFDLFYNRKKMDSYMDRKTKQLHIIITNHSNWKGNNLVRFFEYGVFTFFYHYTKKILAVRNNKYCIPDLHNKEYKHFTQLSNCKDFDEAISNAYNYLCNYSLLMNAITNDDYVRFMHLPNWSKREVEGFTIYSTTIENVSVSINQSNDGINTIDIGSILGKKKFYCISEAQKIAYNFIRSGEYKKYVNNKKINTR